MPNYHLAEMCRLGRRKYKLLESYDAWLRGGVLDPGHYGPRPGEEGCDVIDVVEDDYPDGEVARVTALLGVMLPHYFDFQSVPDDLVDARIPLEGQQERFAQLGWDTIPSTGRLMQRMVEYVEDRVAIHIIAGELNSAGRPRGLTRLASRRVQQLQQSPRRCQRGQPKAERYRRFWQARQTRPCATTGHGASTDPLQTPKRTPGATSRRQQRWRRLRQPWATTSPHCWSSTWTSCARLR